MRRWFIKNPAHSPVDVSSTTSAGIFLFLLGIALLTAMDASVKWLVEDRVHVIQLLFVRSCFITVMLTSFYALRRQIRILKPVRTTAQCVRGLIGFLAPFAFFLSLKYLPLTAASVVFFSNIFMITLASAVFLKEKVGLYRWGAVAVGYAGVLIAIDPNAEGELFGYVMVLVSSAAYAFLFISGKKLGATESSASLVLFYNLGVGAVALLFLPAFWNSLLLSDWLGLMLVSVLAVFGQYCMTQGFSLAEASLLAPLNYSALVLTVLFDWVLWQSIPGMQTLLGAAIIVLSSAFVIYRQNQQALATKSHAKPPS